MNNKDLTMTKKLIKNIGVLATPTGGKAKAGNDQGKIDQLEQAWLLWEDEKIIALGQGTPPQADEVIDANGHLVTRDWSIPILIWYSAVGVSMSWP